MGMFEIVIGDEAYWNNQREASAETFAGYLSPGEDQTMPWVQQGIERAEALAGWAGAAAGVVPGRLVLRREQADGREPTGAAATGRLPAAGRDLVARAAGGGTH